MNVYESDYYKTSSQKDKVAATLFAEGSLDVESLTAHVYHEATKKNKNKLNQYVKRLEDDHWLVKDKSETPMVLRLTEKAQSCIENILKSENRDDVEIENIPGLDIEVKDRFTNFLDTHNTESRLLTNTERYELDFKEVALFDMDLADALLKKPSECLKTLRVCLDLYSAFKQHGIVVKNAESYVDKKQIGDLRVQDYNNLVCFDGLVKTKTNVKGVITETLHKCPRCTTKQKIKQDDDKKLKKPRKCPECGWKGSFYMADAKCRNRLKVKVNELFDAVDRQPEDILVEVWDSLADMDLLKKAGTRIQVTGVYESRIKEKSRETKTVVKALNVEPLENEYTNLEISDEDIRQIHSIGRKNPMSFFCKKTFPAIHGWDMVKKSLVLQAMSCDTTANNTKRKRGDIHILMAGDPGVAKSSFMRNAMKIYGKSTKTGGKGSTGVGLIGSVTKDEDLGEWVLEGGALATNTDGLVCVDEFDKMGEESRSSMHEAMEDQEVPIHKANIHSHVKTKTSILAACNPKHSRFESENKYDEIDLKHSLMQRFDLVWAMEDKVCSDKDEAIGETILDDTPETDFKQLRKYVTYARQNYKPRLSDEVKQDIITIYKQIRKSHGRKSNIGPRFLESIERLSKAHARLCLRDKVERKDFVEAFKLVQVSLDMLYGTRNSPVVEEDIQVSFTHDENGVRAFIESYDGQVPEEDFVDEFNEEMLQQYKNKKVVYSPRSGYVRLLR